MISVGAAIGIITVATVLVLTPGPNMMYLVSRTLTQGRRAGLISLAGVAVGFGVYLTATNLGLAEVFVAVPDLYLAVKIAGTGYLAWLAFKTLRPRRHLGVRTGADEPATHPAGCSSWVCCVQPPQSEGGGPLSVADPAVRTTPRRTSGAAGNSSSGLLQITVALTGNLLILLGAAGIAKVLRRRPGWLRAQRVLMGTVLGALAIKLATDRARPSVG